MYYLIKASHPATEYDRRQRGQLTAQCNKPWLRNRNPHARGIGTLLCWALVRMCQQEVTRGQPTSPSYQQGELYPSIILPATWHFVNPYIIPVINMPQGWFSHFYIPQISCFVFVLIWWGTQLNAASSNSEMDECFEDLQVGILPPESVSIHR